MKRKYDEEKIINLEYSSSSGIINFYNDAVKLKHLYRQGWLQRGLSEKQCESVAEHTFSMAILALAIIKENNLKLDLSKTLSMILVHDLGEIIAGDFTPQSGISAEDKYEKELNGLAKVFSSINSGGEFIKLWKEFEAGNTAESKLVKQIDKLEMALQANIYERTENIDLSEFYSSASEVIKDTHLKNIFSSILRERKI